MTRLAAAIALAVLGLAACSGGNEDDGAQPAEQTPTKQGQARMRPDVEATEPDGAATLPAGSVIVRLRPQGRMGQAGTAVLEQLAGGGTRVTLEISPAHVERQPAQIQLNECRLAGPVQWELKAVVAGRSQTTINRSVDWIRDAQVSVSVMQGAKNYTPTACGDVPPPAR